VSSKPGAGHIHQIAHTRTSIARPSATVRGCIGRSLEKLLHGLTHESSSRRVAGMVLIVSRMKWRRNISLANRRRNLVGPRNPNWKGGRNAEHTRLRKTVRYAEWRTAVFTRDDFTCLKCGVRGGRLEADHIKPFSLFPALRFELSNGRTLCKPCHRTYGWNGNQHSVKRPTRRNISLLRDGA
jgi:hypothetical protein